MAKRSTELPPQIHSLTDDQSRFIRMIIFGEPGMGKTPLACTAPNALVLDGDGGLESARVAGSRAKVWTMEDWDDALKAYTWLAEGGYKKFEWLVFDGITLFQEKGLDQIMNDLVKVKTHRSVFLPDKGEYGQNMSRITRFLRDLKRLPINQIWTAHAAFVEITKADGETYDRMMPQIQGNGLPSKICGYVPIVGHMELIEKKVNGKIKETPVFTTRRIGGWYGKDRFGAIGRMLNPTIPKIVAAIESKRSNNQPITEQGE